MFSGLGIAVVMALMVSGAVLLVVGLVVMVNAPRPPPESPGRCLSCGYDLTGVAKRRCPECGLRLGRGGTRRPDLLLRRGLARADRLLTWGVVCLTAGMVLAAVGGR